VSAAALDRLAGVAIAGIQFDVGQVGCEWGARWMRRGMPSFYNATTRRRITYASARAASSTAPLRLALDPAILAATPGRRGAIENAALCYLYLARNERSAGTHGQAIEHYREALRRFEQIGSPNAEEARSQLKELGAEE
jgi:hypothetical protein